MRQRRGLRRSALAAGGLAWSSLSSAQVLNQPDPFIVAPEPGPLSSETAPGRIVPDERALKCLTEAVYYEAGFEPVAGRRAVAQVVLNRLAHPRYPKSVCAVVYQGSERRTGCQFTFTCDGALGRPPDPARWNEAAAIAAAALSGQVTREVGAATHYHAAYVRPAWAPRLTRIARIGLHIFYQGRGGGVLPGAAAGPERVPDARPSPPAPITEARAIGFSPWGLRIAAVTTAFEPASE